MSVLQDIVAQGIAAEEMAWREFGEQDYDSVYRRLATGLFIAATDDFDLNLVMGGSSSALDWIREIIRDSLESGREEGRSPGAILEALYMQGITVGYALKALDDYREGLGGDGV
jgi:hypothetical protein